MSNLEVNWDIFNYKFNGRQRESFEKLSYYLFCSEFNQPIGIYRYMNQAGIETNPIYIDDKCIGFQSKYYDAPTKISTKEADFKKAIKTAKNKNKDINNLIFYINKEFSESSKKNQKKPTYQTNTEEYGEKIGIEINWRVPSNIEIQLSHIENKEIREYYFSNEDSMVNHINNMIEHTDNLFKSIKTAINKDTLSIKIEREIEIKEIEDKLIKNNIILITGNGGCGKTAILKQIYEKEKESIPFLSFKANEFNVTNLNELFKLFGNFNIYDFKKYFKDENKKIICIDSAEKIFLNNNNDILFGFINEIIEYGWKIIFTIRNNYVKDIVYCISDKLDASFSIITVDEISEDKLERLFRDNNLELPKSDKIVKMLCNLFYLKEYINIIAKIKDTDISVNRFKENLWNNKICNNLEKMNNMHIRREQMLIKLIEDCYKKEKFGTDFEIKDKDGEALSKLKEDEIIDYDKAYRVYYVTHDIYEEWTIERIIEKYYLDSPTAKTFLDNIGQSLRVRKGFRLWLINNIENNNDSRDIVKLIKEIVSNNDIDCIWKDETLISVMMCNTDIINSIKDILTENDYKLLFKSMILLNTACQTVDDTFTKQIFTYAERKSNYIYTFTKPFGNGWMNIISILYENIDRIKFNYKNINYIVKILYKWNNYNRAGETTKFSSLIGIKIYDKIKKSYSLKQELGEDTLKTIIGIILNGTIEIQSEVEIIIKDVMKNCDKSKNYDICKYMLASAVSDNQEVIKIMPDLLISLMDKMWKKKELEEENRYYHRDDVEDWFGIEKNSKYNQSSAFQTPILLMLKIHPDKTLKFIIDFTNYSVNNYVKSQYKGNCKQIIIKNNKETLQYIDNRIWNMYRGTQISTILLESIHMALERWLLQIIEDCDVKYIENICIKLLNESISASTTAVIASLVMAHPDKLFKIAHILMQTKEIFIYDTGRYTLEYSTNLMGMSPNNEIYNNERIRSNRLPFRKIVIEQVIFNYQLYNDKIDMSEFEDRKNKIYEVLDNYYKDYESVDEDNFLFYLYRIDIRKQNMEKLDDNRVILTTVFPEKLEKLRVNKSATIYNTYIELNNWATNRFEKNVEKYSRYDKYEENYENVYKEMIEIDKLLDKQENDYLTIIEENIPTNIATVLIRDFNDKIKSEEKLECYNLIMKQARKMLKKQFNNSANMGTNQVLCGLSIIIESNNEYAKEAYLIELNLMLKDIEEDSKGAFSNYMWEYSPKNMKKLLITYSLLINEYEDMVLNSNFNQKRTTITIDDFLVEKEEKIDDIYNNNYDLIVNNIKNINTKI